MLEKMQETAGSQEYGTEKSHGREFVLFRYLREGTAPRCYLVTGEWGSGKTYEIDHFFEKYYKYSNRKIYRISCFGISSRKELIEEINNTIEREDDSFYTFSIQALKYIPVVGDALYKVLKKSYYNRAFVLL